MPADSYKHLRIEREWMSNDRRTRKWGVPPRKLDDIRAHGKRLHDSLVNTISIATKHDAVIPGSCVMKLNYTGILDFAHIHKHGVDFVSQEGQQVCIVFANEEGLEKFANHLKQLGVEDKKFTYMQILEALNGIDNWTPQDRKSWAVQHIGFTNTDTFKLDIELWPRHEVNHPERIALCTGFEHWLQKQNIKQLDKVNLDSLLMYRIQVSSGQTELLLNHNDVRLVDLIPATGISYNQLNRDINTIVPNIPSPAANAAKICILDSGINTNHPLLKPAIAESASFINELDEFDHNGHGTAVAGISLYGDLESCNKSNTWQPEIWLYNGKILGNNAGFDEHSIEKTLIDAVQYFVELGCRIFNLSIGNINAPYDGEHIRGIAYVLDDLARKHDILFIVSAGNFSGSESPPVPEESWRDEYPEYLLSNESVIIDPAPALNVLTIGSLARHNATREAQQYPKDLSQLSPASENQPSPFTRHGPSVKGALKPELVATGGNFANPIRRQGKQWKAIYDYLGVLTCNHEFLGKTLFKEVSGTSFAAPYITHLAGRFLNEYPKSSANLVRAMLVNHANLPDEVKKTFPEAMQTNYKETHNRDIARDVAGYGMIDEDALYRSSDNVVVLMADDSIENDSHQFFELPLPSSYLRTQRATRQLRVTLAYSPVVRTTRIDYRATRIWYRLVKGKSLEEVQKHFNRDTQNETNTRNDDATKNRTISSELRDKGTVQSSIWEFRSRTPNEKWFVVVTRQDRDWGKCSSYEQERYALVVTVADHDNEHAKLYTQISHRIQEQEYVRSRV